MAEQAESTRQEKEKEKEKDEEGKKRRFSSFINHGYNNNNNNNSSNKRANAAPIRILMVGRPKAGKSSIISMLLNRDVQPGLNGRGIVVNRIPNESSTNNNQQQQQTPIPITTSLPTPVTQTTTTLPTPIPPRPAHRLSSHSAFQFHTPKTPAFDLATSSEEENDPIEVDSPPVAMSISPPFNPPRFIPPAVHSNSSPSLLNTSRRIYHSDKYIITDIDGFYETSNVDIVGTILEHRKWLEDSMQGYNLVLMVVKAQELTETDRKIFALCNALLHDLRDMIHIAVTGCDSNPKWIQENELEIRRVYGTSKTVGVAFPSTDGGLLECIFEQLRKDSLILLEDYISKNATINPRVPIRAPRGGSVGSGKKVERTRTRTFSR